MVTTYYFRDSDIPLVKLFLLKFFKNNKNMIYVKHLD